MNRGLLGTAPPVARARVFAVALALALGTTSAAAAPADAGSDSGAADAVTAFVRDLEAPAVDKDVERAIKRARAHGRDLESSLAALDPTDVGSVEPASFGKLLLRQADSLSSVSDALTELLEVQVHPRVVEPVDDDESTYYEYQFWADPGMVWEGLAS